jgi:hypothetical protein
MVLYLLLIVNKAGGLIYHYPFTTQQDGAGLNKLTSNEYLVLAGMFHGIHAISARLPTNTKGSKVKDSGIQRMHTPHFTLNCHQTMTGIKFIVATDVNSTSAQVDAYLNKIKQAYVDFAMKNPFYTLDMPIRCDLFDQSMLRLKQQQQQQL